MADEVKGHPPTGRRLGRLWAQGITPVSGALVGAVVLGVAALIVALGRPWLVAQAQGALTGALGEAARQVGGHAGPPLHGMAGGHLPLQSVLSLAWRMSAGAWLIVAGIGAVLLVTAVVAHQMQLAPRGDTGTDMGRAAGELRGGGGELGWLGFSALVPLLAVLVAGRAALAGGAALMVPDAAEALRAAAGLGMAVAMPLLAALWSFGLLDVLVRRSAFMGAAQMSRRELEDELRLTEGHPLTRRHRRATGRREGGDAQAGRSTGHR